jgi:uridylate kinase
MIGYRLEIQMKNERIILISLGGAIICPNPGEINASFLKQFKSLILKFLKKNCKFIIVTGGGKICRTYQEAAKHVAPISDEDKDWLGIHVTRLNAHLLRTILRKVAYPVVLDDPGKPIEGNWKVLIGAGWRPGCSTDFDAVLLAKRFGAKEIINASNTSFVYNKDFRKHKDAYPIKKISWTDYRKLIGTKWTPGMSAPFDPIASKLANELKIRTFVIKGTDIKNFDNLLSGKTFTGSTIEP